MITERWVFLDRRLPDNLHHRHTEKEQLCRALEPATRGERAEDVLIHGPSGVGKTTTIRHTLKREFRDRGIQWTLVNSSNTRSAILHEAAIKHDTDIAVRPNSPAGDLVDALNRAVDRPYIVVLDEADTIRDLDVLQDLYEIPLVSVVAIVHEPREWLARLDDDLREFFRLKSQVEFERYSQDELVDILRPRAEHGLEPGAVRDGQLRWIADEVAGVARYGIQSLLSAAELAEEREHDYLHERDIGDSFGRARAKMRASNLRSLPFGPCVIYELVREESGDWVESTHIQDEYASRAEEIYKEHDQEPVSNRQVRNYLEKLREYNLIDSRNETCWREYRVIDSDLEAPIELESTQVSRH